MPVILAVDRGGQILLHIERRVRQAVAIGFKMTSKFPRRRAPRAVSRASPILLHSSMSQVATYLRGWSTLRFNNWKMRLSAPASFNRRLPSARDFSMPGQ
jgi:hypothetical protein